MNDPEHITMAQLAHSVSLRSSLLAEPSHFLSSLQLINTTWQMRLFSGFDSIITDTATALAQLSRTDRSTTSKILALVWLNSASGPPLPVGKDSICPNLLPRYMSHSLARCCLMNLSCAHVPTQSMGLLTALRKRAKEQRLSFLTVAWFAFMMLKISTWAARWGTLYQQETSPR